MWSWVKEGAARALLKGERGGSDTADATPAAPCSTTPLLLPPLSAELLGDDYTARAAAFDACFCPHGYAYSHRRASREEGQEEEEKQNQAAATATTAAPGPSSSSFAALLAREYAHVRRAGLYLDYAGAAPYARTPVRQAADELVGDGGGGASRSSAPLLLRNPHSVQGGHSNAPACSARALDDLRAATLRALRASPRDYAVVLTSGATGALKLLAEATPWGGGGGGRGGVFAYAEDSHTSVVGAREEALARGARAARAVRLPGCWDPREQEEDGVDQRYRGRSTIVQAGELMMGAAAATAGGCHVGEAEEEDGEADDGGGASSSSSSWCLLALPAECNFSGHRLDPAALGELQRKLASPEGAAAAVDDVLGARRGEEETRGGAAAGDASCRRPSYRWAIVLDAAKAFSTRPPDLSVMSPDAVVLSYYKAGGHPTGLGALVVRRRPVSAAGREDDDDERAPHALLPVLLRSKGYFGGGTVEGATAAARWFARRPGAAGLEDGTPAYTLARGATLALEFLEREFGWGGGGGGAGRNGSSNSSPPPLSPCDAHASCLSLALAAMLSDLRHDDDDGSPAAVLYLSPRALRLAHEARALLPPVLRRGQGEEGRRRQDPSPPPARGWAELLEEWRACQGPTVTFNLLGPTGTREEGSNGNSASPATTTTTPNRQPWIGHVAVRRLADIHGVALRTGCFCNPGACAAWLGLTPEDARRAHAAGRVCWGDSDATADGARPDGAVRASLGPASSFEDVCGLLGLIERYFVVNKRRGQRLSGGGPAAAGCSTTAGLTPPTRPRAAPAALCGNSGGVSGTVSALYIYPVKSCGAQAVGGGGSSSPRDPWPLCATGLAWDRAWAVVGPDGTALTQRAAPALATVRPRVDLRARTLTLTRFCCSPDGEEDGDDGCRPLVVPLLPLDSAQQTERAAPVSVCGERAAACGAKVRPAGEEGAADAAAAEEEEAAWWRTVTGLDGCRLVLLAAAREGSAGQPLSFANEGQLLVVSEASGRALSEAAAARRWRRAAAAGGVGSNQSSEAATSTVDMSRFRPNVVLSGFPAWAEDGWAAHNAAASSAAAAERAGSEGAAATTLVLRVGPDGAELAPLAPCARCDLVRVDQRTGRRGGAEALAALADPELRARRRAVAAAADVAAAAGAGQTGSSLPPRDPISGIAFGVLASSYGFWRRCCWEHGCEGEEGRQQETPPSADAQPPQKQPPASAALPLAPAATAGADARPASAGVAQAGATARAAPLSGPDLSVKRRLQSNPVTFRGWRWGTRPAWRFGD